MKITEFIERAEGRRLEYKQEMPVVFDLAKTIVAFANDAGGDLYIGVSNNPRELVGINSPGNLPPFIEFQEMEARQSAIRNKVIAPIFKHMGIIDQWGNGLKIISNELKAYPEIEFKWFEKVLQFQMHFIKKNYQPLDEQNIDIESVGKNMEICRD